MFRPTIGARIEKSREDTCGWDKGTYVAAFRPIAKRAGKRQVFGLGLTAMLFADDVINFTAEEGIVLMNQAIFTEVLRPGCD